MLNNDIEIKPIPRSLRVKIQSFLLAYRWASLLFALIFILIQRNVTWWIIFAAIAYNVIATICLRRCKLDCQRYPSLLFFDLVICAFFVVAGGYAAPVQALNPFFLHAFTPLLSVAISYQVTDGLLAAVILSISYFFAPSGDSTEALAFSEFTDTHVANLLSFFFIAVIVSQVADVIKTKLLDQAIPDMCEFSGVEVDSNIEKLSIREKEILFMLSHGANNKEIADALFVNEKTIKNYTSRIYKKLGIKGRTSVIGLKADD